MPKGSGRRVKPGGRITTRRLQSMVNRGVGGVSASRGGVSQVGGGGNIGIDPPREIPYRPFILARVTGSAELSTNRWKYGWTEIVINGDDDEDKAGGRSGTTTDNYAISLPEINATGSGVQPNGVDLDGQIFTDNPDLGPVPLGDNAPVLIFMAPNQAGGLKPLIVASIAIDGDCAA